MSIDKKNSAQERFELLSAYVDNEVTNTERKQVEQWLRDDPNYLAQYHQLLKVQRLLLDLPVPASPRTEQIVNQVITKIQRRSQRKFAIGATLIAIVVGTFGSMTTSNRWQVADESINKEEQLILAMEEPIIPMPQSLSVGDR